MKLSKLLLSSVMLLSLTGCCWTDHSETIKEVAEPMVKEFEKFYEEYKRFPTSKDRDIMLKKVGCSMKGAVCQYKNKHIYFKERRVVDYYDLIMIYENTSCPIYLNNNGIVDKIDCIQNPCIDLGQ